ncbi:MAG: hypothetical protein WBS20_04740 [Lysobacterales bacterium]
MTKLLPSITAGLILFTSSLAADDQVDSSSNKSLNENDNKNLSLLRNNAKTQLDLKNLSQIGEPTPEAAYPDTACDPAPLPLGPIGPSQTIDTSRWDDEFSWTVWRYPCNDDFSWVVFTVEPKTDLDKPFICSVDITIVQDGIEESSLKICSDPIDENCDSKCGDVFTKSSYALTKYRSLTSDKIDLNKGFLLYWDLNPSPIQVDIETYDPSLYGGEPVLGNQLAVNGVFYDPNNSGHGFDFNMTEYGLIIYYYGHTVNGERLWLISSAFAEPVVFNSPVTLTMFEVINGTFGNPIKPETSWGSLTLTLTDCDNGVAVLDGIDGKFEMNFTRGAGLKNISCSSYAANTQ